MRTLLFLGLLVACRPSLDPCACPADTPGHGVVLDGACACLPSLPATPNPGGALTIELAEGEAVDWPAVDEALATSDVVLAFAPGGRYERLYVERTDEGPHRLVLDGGAAGGRAVIAGILTPYEQGPRHRITVRGFEITGSRDKGIYWAAGDDVLIEDVVIHGNKGSPALNLDYSSRSGYPSANFTVRNSHIYDQHGECLYIGGSEGEDADSHTGLLLENNLIHDCRSALSSQHDAINVKDRLVDVRVHGNVVLRTDWGIEVASPGVYANNLVLDSGREGFQVSDYFSPIGEMTFLDNAVIGAGHDGFYVQTARESAPGLRFARNTVIGAGQAGLELATEAGAAVEIEDMLVLDSAVGFDGWGEAEITLWSCRTAGNGLDFDRLFAEEGPCAAAETADVSTPAGPDGLFLTEDDPWILPGGAQAR